jgi:hypothetical protein
MPQAAATVLWCSAALRARDCPGAQHVLRAFAKGSAPDVGAVLARLTVNKIRKSPTPIVRAADDHGFRDLPGYRRVGIAKRRSINREAFPIGGET